jgi:mannose/fructose/N-acetylgalactosamine-specific phosphotransferase system component IIC
MWPRPLYLRGYEMKSFLIKMKTKIVNNWNQLFNDPAGPHVVALSYAIGVLALMLTLPTLGLSFLLMIAIIKWTKHSMTAAIVGYFFTKLIALPLAPLELKIGKILLHENFNPHNHRWAWARGLLHKGAELVLGAGIIGIVLAIIFYFVIKQILILRLERETVRKDQTPE